MAISSCSCAEKMELGACGCSCQRCCATSGVSMRRPNIIIGIVVLVVCGTLAGMFWPEKQMPEPVYKGKKLSEWVRAVAIAEMGWSKEENEAIQAFGTNAVPFY